MKKRKQQMAAKIKLKDINHTVGSLNNAGDVIRNGLPKYIVFSKEEYNIIYHSLEFFNFKKRSYKYQDRSSVEKKACILLNKFGIYEHEKINQVFKSDSVEKDYDPISHFLKHIVGFHKLPLTVLEDLERKVKSNLKQLLLLIDEYEQNPIINNYKQGIKRNEHTTKLIIDFYDRCLTERNAIVKYLSNDIETRAIFKARQDPLFRGFGLMWHEELWDRPYKWWQHRSIEFFDYRKINNCRHRLDYVTVKHIPQLEKLYKTDKTKFYQKLKKFISAEQVFHELKTYYVKTLPKITEREPIFIELEKLFKARLWYAFTALALTQVEGVFSDMLYISLPQKNFSSLSTKVLAIRPFYNYEERNFDYFEYQLPFLRNSFLHSGSIKDRNFKTVSYDLLYDLHYLLTIFRELNDPHIELHKLLQNNSTEIIDGIKSLNHFFKLVGDINKRYKLNPSTELKETLNKWENFEKNTLAPSAEIEYYAEIVNEYIDADISNFFTQIGMQTKYDDKGKEINLSEITVKYLSDNISDIKLRLSDYAYSLSEEYFKIMDVLEFIKTYKNYLPSCPIYAVNVFNNIQTRNKNNFAKLFLLKELFISK